MPLRQPQFSTLPPFRFQQEVREESAREKDEKKRGQLESFIAKNIGGGAKGASMAKSRQKMLAKMSAAPDQDVSDPTVRFKIPNPGTGLACGGRFRFFYALLPYVGGSADFPLFLPCAWQGRSPAALAFG